MSPRRKRHHQRYQCRIPVKLVTEEGELEAVALNISLGGMLVEAPQPLAFGTKVKARFELPALGAETEVDATVRWNRENRVGLQFGSLRAKQVWALNKLFKSSRGS